ncbi:MAG: hypothetical protein JXA99_09385 [Candidatus Lokiarchaeota archaeon]|nr:hypothetical protein [Candidatus Lokiarchaeota archaeon]
MKKRYSLILIIIGSLSPLLFSTWIPYILPERVQLDEIQTYQDSSGLIPKQYIVHMTQGNAYTISADPSGYYYSFDVGIKIGDSPYMITGYTVDEAGEDDIEIMNFIATRTGDYYIQIFTTGFGFFDFIVESGLSASATGPNVEFFDSIYLLVLILPSVIIFVIAVIIYVVIKRQPKISYQITPISPSLNPYRTSSNKESISNLGKKKIKFCEFCGSMLDESSNICPQCRAPIMR